jgi:N-acetylmuramoyl-L-alanine amidase
MKNKTRWLLLACGVSIVFLVALRVALVGAAAQTLAAVCFWSDQGPVCVERSVAEESGEALLTALLAGPTLDEQAQGLWSAIPEGTTLDRVEVRTEGAVVVYLRLSQAALGDLDHGAFEIVVRQVGGTLEPLRWRDLRIQTWDARKGTFVPLASFLPETPALRKEAAPAGEGALDGAPGYVGQPPAFGQGQPRGALTGKTVYVSAGHGWEWTGSAWRTQRPPYPTGGYVGPIIEDHNNAEAVNEYLLQYLWNAGATVIPVRERDMNGAEVIVDNDSPTPGTGYAETGAWTTTGAAGTGYGGTDYRYAETVTGTATATAAWTATLPADGRYAVYAWYRQGSNRAPDARYTVHHAGGETTVAVDQRVHGNTWHYLGTYGFLAGEEARVTLTNQSSVTGTAVIADAVRFGGGTFDELTSAISTTATYAPDEPWWEVCTFYYSQRMGMDKPPGDVTARPLYARWEHAGTGEDAVYVSWHTNGASSGYQTSTRGTMSIVYNGEVVTKPITAGSIELRNAIHAELVHDIRAGWDPTWPEYTRSMNLGELRELWDEEEANRMPGALIEIAFHDHPGDTDALKEPVFEMLAARGVYQGILHYFDPDGVELPEPPTHLAVRNVGGGALRVSWQAPLTDAIGLVGDAAAGYRVYTSTNGVGWSNGMTVTGTTAYTLAGLSSGQLVHVRVAATNAGGESFPTEVLAARVGKGAGVLLVGGFDRLDRSLAVPETDPTEGYNVRLFLDRMNGYNYTIQHGEAIPYAFDGASNEAVKDGLVELGQYAILDWIVGEESTVDETLDATERALLATYLDGGGALFISGAEIGWDLDLYGTNDDRVFYNNYLRADYARDDAETYQVGPASGSSIFAGSPSFSFHAPGMYDADYPDQLMPLGGAIPALAYQGGAGGTAAVQYENGCERVVYFGFPFETIEPGRRADVMAQVLGFLDECLAMPVDTAIISPADGSAYNTLPDFLGTAGAGVAALDQVEVQIEREEDGRYWAEGTWVITETWLVASGTSVWSYTLPAPSLGDDEYTLRARAWTTDPYSDTSPAEVTFIYDTIAPTSTLLITPTGGITVLAAAGVTLEWTPVDPGGGSPVSYVVELDGQAACTTAGTSCSIAHIGVGSHTWRVQVVDAAGNASGWASADFSVSGYSVWLPLVMREEPPSPPPSCDDVIVNGDFESDEGWVLNRLAVYTTGLAHSGARSARVGIPPGEIGEFAYSSVMQVIALTEGSSATLSVWVYPIGEGGDSGDAHYIGIWTQVDAYVPLDAWQSNAQNWERREYDLSPYIGQTVTIYIGTRNDGDDDTSTLYVDDVALEICP